MAPDKVKHISVHNVPQELQVAHIRKVEELQGADPETVGFITDYAHSCKDHGCEEGT